MTLPEGSVSPLDPSELSHLLIMHGVASESVWGLLQHCPVVEHPPGVVLISPERGERTLFLVLKGSLSVHLGGPSATPIAVLDRGQAVGEISVIDARAASAWVVTAGPSRLLAVDEPTFWRLVGASHAFSINLLMQLAQRMRANNQQLSDTVERSRMLEREASTDGLTNLFNRRWLDQRLPRFVARHKRGGRALSLLLLDVDHFKRFNDQHGHAVGDAVLALVAQTISLSVRPSDVAARYGGEELVIILPDTELEGAKVVAERLRLAIAEARLPGSPLQVTVSIGIATLESEDEAAGLLERADQLLYRAKAAGRNRVEA